MRRFHISTILICMVLLITSSFSQALADYDRILNLNKPLYNPDKENLSGRLCWQICGYFGEDEYSSNYIRAFDLATGKSKTYYGTGMIIQKNPQEYHGALLAKLNEDGSITIFHQDGADTNEIVYNGYLPENIADYYEVTIEAYMNGAIYYTTYADHNSPFRLKRYHTDTGYIYIYKINKDGTSLSASNFQLSPDGRAAWISRNSGSPSIDDSYPSFQTKASQIIYIEDPATNQVEEITSVERIEDHLGRKFESFGYCFCWLDSQTLILDGKDPDTHDFSLIKLDISTQDSSLCLDENGNEIIITEEPDVFVMYPKPDGSMIAIFAGETFYIKYPIIVDLKTGKIHHIYGYSLESSSHEYCNFCNLSWYELK